jgi:hypothetical protein
MIYVELGAYPLDIQSIPLSRALGQQLLDLIRIQLRLHDQAVETCPGHNQCASFDPWGPTYALRGDLQSFGCQPKCLVDKVLVALFDLINLPLTRLRCQK